jgi:hypothetical protein
MLSRILGPESSRSSFIEFGALLSGAEYQFALQWLTNRGFWQLRVTDPRRSEVIRGLRVTGDTDIFQPFNSMPRLPPGRLIAYDTTNQGADPGRDDWIERHLLIYQDPVVVAPTDYTRITPVAPPGGPQ